jgi:hypothetical protein
VKTGSGGDKHRIQMDIEGLRKLILSLVTCKAMAASHIFCIFYLKN